jgi:hypothetical protein
MNTVVTGCPGFVGFPDRANRAAPRSDRYPVNNSEELAKSNAEIAKRIQEMTLRNLELQRLHLEEDIERLRAQNRRLPF